MFHFVEHPKVTHFLNGPYHVFYQFWQTFISPGCSPGVLDKPEVFSVFSSISDGQNSVIQVLSLAFGLIVDT